MKNSQAKVEKLWDSRQQKVSRGFCTQALEATRGGPPPAMWGRDLFGAGGPLCVQWHSDIAGLSLECWGKEVLSIILPVGIVFTSIPKVITFLSLKWSEDVRATNSLYSNLPLCTREVEAQRRECLDEGHPAVKAGGAPAPRLPPAPGYLHPGCRPRSSASSRPKVRVPFMEPQVDLGLLSSKEQTTFGFSKQMETRELGSDFPRGPQNTPVPVSPSFYCKEHESRHSSSGGHGKGAIPRCCDA